MEYPFFLQDPPSLQLSVNLPFPMPLALREFSTGGGTGSVVMSEKSYQGPKLGGRHLFWTTMPRFTWMGIVVPKPFPHNTFKLQAAIGKCWMSLMPIRSCCGQLQSGISLIYDTVPQPPFWDSQASPESSSLTYSTSENAYLCYLAKEYRRASGEIADVFSLCVFCNRLPPNQVAPLLCLMFIALNIQPE